MKMKMFTVYDSVADTYMMPWFAANEAVAKRNFANCVNDSSHNFNHNPTDYTLFYLGIFDDETCHFGAVSTPISLGLATTYLRKES